MLIAKGEKKEICFSNKKVTITFCLEHSPDMDSHALLIGSTTIEYKFFSCPEGRFLKKSYGCNFYNHDMVGEEEFYEAIKKENLDLKNNVFNFVLVKIINKLIDDPDSVVDFVRYLKSDLKELAYTLIDYCDDNPFSTIKQFCKKTECGYITDDRYYFGYEKSSLGSFTDEKS